MIYFKLGNQSQEKSEKIACYKRASLLATDPETKALLIDKLVTLGDENTKIQIPLMLELARNPNTVARAELFGVRDGTMDRAARLAKIERALKLATSEIVKAQALTSRALLRDDVAVCKDAAQQALALPITPINRIKLERLVAKFETDVDVQASARARSLPRDDEQPHKRQRMATQPIETELQNVKMEPQRIKTRRAYNDVV